MRRCPPLCCFSYAEFRNGNGDPQAETIEARFLEPHVADVLRVKPLRSAPWLSRHHSYVACQQVNVDNTKSLRIVIQSAWNGDFAAIYSVSVA